MSESILISILKDQIKPALGCTEPVAVALTAARARDLLAEPLLRLRITANANILKNGMGVGIPGVAQRGIDFAAALGICCGKFEYGLEVFRDVTQDAADAAQALLNGGGITVALNKDAHQLYICAEAFGEHHHTRVIVENAHTNFVYEERDGIALMNRRQISAAQDTAASEPKQVEIKYGIQNYTIAQLIDFAKTAPLADLHFLNDGVEMNRRLSDVGISESVGLGMGSLMLRQADTRAKARAYTAAASEARMSGYPLPVMSSAGSGNHGLLTFIPLSVLGEDEGIPKETIIRSIALAHLVTIYVKTYIGALSPVCGCGVAAGLGFAAGHAMMYGGSDRQIEHAITNTIAGVTGMICDGAKLGCAYKLAISFDAAIGASDMALSGIEIPLDNGILADTVEQSIQNLAEVSNIGMSNTDASILEIMLRSC